MDLLPLREKVSAKLTDEGSRRSLPSDFKPLATGGRRPLIRRLRRHLLPQGEKDGEAIAPRERSYATTPAAGATGALSGKTVVSRARRSRPMCSVRTPLKRARMSRVGAVSRF